MSLFTPVWVQKLKKTPELAQNCKVSIWDPDNQVSELVGKKYETVIQYTLQNTPARVQPVRAAVQKFVAVNGTEVQVVQFSLPIDSRVNIRPGTKVRVTDAELNFALKSFIFVVKEVMDSGNPIEWTFTAEADTELVDNGT